MRHISLILEDLMMTAPFVRNPYNYDVERASDEAALFCKDESLTVQAPRDEVDINTIVRRFGLTGQLPENVAAPTYGDFVGVDDYHSAMNAVAKANEAFEMMPAEVRARFGNDPAAFVDFCSDDKNREEAGKLGLLLPAKEVPKGGAAAPVDNSSKAAPDAK